MRAIGGVLQAQLQQKEFAEWMVDMSRPAGCGGSTFYPDAAKPKYKLSTIWDPAEREHARRYEVAKIKYQQFTASLSQEKVLNTKVEVPPLPIEESDGNEGEQFI